MLEVPYYSLVVYRTTDLVLIAVQSCFLDSITRVSNDLVRLIGISPFSEELKELYKQTTGNVLVASGIVAYFGPFTVQYRDNLLRDWCERCQEENIRVSETVSLNSVLGR